MTVPVLLDASAAGRIGQHAAAFVLDRLDGMAGARRVLVPFRIVERASS